MNIEPEKRKEIQKILEEFIEKQSSFADKRFALIILSFIYELNQHDKAAAASGNGLECPNKDGVCIWEHFKQIQGTFSELEIPDVFDETFLNAFTSYAQNINTLACAVNHLSELLHDRYAQNFPTKPPPGSITQ